MKSNKSHLILMLVVSLCASVIYAQEQDPLPVHRHTVSTLSGSVLKGEIVEWNTEQITLRLLSGANVTLDVIDVEKVTSRGVRIGKDWQTRGPRQYQFRDRGVYNVSTLGASAGPFFGLGVSHATGYRFTHWFGLGGGLGIVTYDLGSGNQIVPVFAEVRGFLLQKHFSPYYALRAGYGFPLLNPENSVLEAHGGALLHAEIGYRFGAGGPVNFFTGLGMHWQTAQYLYDRPWESIFFDKVTYRRTELRLGVIF